MSKSVDRDWAAYYRANVGRAPRDWLQVALDLCGPAGEITRRAVDLGCGDGTETLALLDAGWRVLAVDRQPEAIRWVRERTPAGQASRLELQNAPFESATLGAADLIYAYASLPFSLPADFPATWQKVRAALNPGGRFAGQIFGVRDEWAEDTRMTFLTVEQARALLEGLEIERFDEFDGQGNSFLGSKHWHYFNIVARNPTARRATLPGN